MKVWEEMSFLTMARLLATHECRNVIKKCGSGRLKVEGAKKLY